MNTQATTRDVDDHYRVTSVVGPFRETVRIARLVAEAERLALRGFPVLVLCETACQARLMSAGVQAKLLQWGTFPDPGRVSVSPVSAVAFLLDWNTLRIQGFRGAVLVHHYVWECHQASCSSAWTKG